VKKSKIYTRTGDAGETSLVSGTRAPKSDARIMLYGEVDELNSRIGVLVASLRTETQFALQMAFLEEVQSGLFDLGSNLACEAFKRSEWKLPQVSSDLVQRLESSIDQMDGALDPLKNFVLPGGHETAALAHLCRTSCRAVERLMVSYQHESGEELPVNGLMFINRLSDYFFVLARWFNKKMNIGETPWKPS
jgi:cob(I)alamin adenosyltransferase